jgi:hypothetical protein
MSTGKRFGAIVLALTAAFAVAAQPATAGKKPDLAVKSVKFFGDAPYYIVLDRTGNGLVASVVVKNQGRKATTGEGKLIVQGSGALRPTKFVFDVPKIKPGDSETIEFDVEGADLDGITTYATKACASTKKDSKESNDCRAGPDFAVIPRTWTGSTNATWTDGLVIQSLVSNNATFTFNAGRTEATGAFVYVASGSLTATITGDYDPDCSFSGTGDAAIDPDRASLTLDTDLFTYRATGTMPSTITYTAQAACDDNPAVSYSQEFGDWIVATGVRRDADDETLTGTHIAPPPDTWSWNLRAE